MTPRILTLTAVGALVASMALAGCSKQDQETAKTATSDTAAQVDQKAREVGNDASQAMDKAKVATADAASKISAKVDDAVITTSVKAEIAKAPDLSAMKINVDTDNGRVALRGTAPSAAAKEQATTVASNVKGVVSVDNQLTIEAGKM